MICISYLPLEPRRLQNRGSSVFEAAHARKLPRSLAASRSTLSTTRLPGKSHRRSRAIAVRISAHTSWLHFIRNDWLDSRTSGFGQSIRANRRKGHLLRSYLPMNNSGLCTNWTKADGTCSSGLLTVPLGASWALRTTGLLVLQTGCTLAHGPTWRPRSPKLPPCSSRTFSMGWPSCSALQSRAGTTQAHAVVHPHPALPPRGRGAWPAPLVQFCRDSRQQRTLRELASSFDWAVMDVLQMTMLRPDVRAPFSNRHNYLPGGMHPGDCLHLYPAHPLRWTDLLSNVVQHCFGRSPRGRAP